jgi:ABC-type Fe3+-citrate transport system substrate-binding protein
MGAVMTKVVKVDFKGPRSVAPLVALDALSTEAQSVVDARGRLGKLLEAEPHTLEDADKRIAELQALKPTDQHLTEVCNQMEHGFQRATLEQIQEQLALLLGAFPSSNTPDPMVYSRMMLNEVLAAEPSVIALTMACSKLRRTLQWPPSIADVLKAIREQEACWQYRLRCVSAIANDHARALSKLVERRAWLARTDEERAAERQYRRDTLRRLKQRFSAAAADMP